MDAKTKQIPPLDAQGTLHGGLEGSIKASASLSDPPEPSDKTRQAMKRVKIMYLVVKTIDTIIGWIRGSGMSCSRR